MSSQKMGLNVEVVGRKEKSFQFGTYSKFARFRINLAKYIHSESLGKEYARWVSRPPSVITDMMPPDLQEVAKKVDLSPAFKSLDIWPFYCLSDSSEEITQAECTKLFKIMNKHKKVLKTRGVSDEFKDSYKRLMGAFEAGKGGSEEVSVIFC